MMRIISLLIACATALLGAARSDAVAGSRTILLLSGSTLWTPLNLGSSLVAWWDASYVPGLTFNGSNISAWTDRKSGIVASQATGANQPGWSATARNGKAGLTFNGSSQFLAFTPAGFPSGSAASTLASAAFSNSSATITISFVFGANAAQQVRAIGKTASNLVAAFGSSNDQSAAEGWAGVDHFAEVLLPAGATPTQSIYVDGGAAETSPLLTFNTGTTTGFIGQWIATGLFWTGTVQQDWVFNGVLSTCQRQKLEGFESWYDGKNGSNLPATHPYKSHAPTVGGAC
jgi:hypothetical protein